MTARETILQALFMALQTISGVKVVRNEVFPERIPDGGLIVMRDGEPGEPEAILSPLSYYWQHRVLLEVAVQKNTAADRDIALDALFGTISNVVAVNKTLNGLCDIVTAQAPDTNILAIEGAASIKAATVTLELIYVTDDPLG
jgi:hypothetical protein